MNKLTGTFIFILLSFCTLGSNFKADSISSLLNSTTDPRTTANLKIELAWIKKYEDLKLSTKTTLENLKQLNQLNDDEGVAIATSYLGVYYYLDNKLPEAVIQLKIAEEYFEREQNVDRLCRVYNNLGVCYGSLYNYIEALSYYNKVLDLKNQLPQVHDISSNLINIASIYYNQGDYNQCINYYEQALVLTIANKNYESTAIVYSNLGASYERLGNYPESINYALKALEVYQNKTENKLAIIRTYSNLGSTYMSLNKLEEARHYYNRSSELNKEANSEGQQIVILNNLAELERLSGNYKQAKTHALKGLSLSIATNNSEEELISLNTLSNIENDLQDYKSSLWYYKEYIQLSDSLLEISNYQKTQLALDQNQLITNQIIQEKDGIQSKKQEKKTKILNGFMFVFGVLVIIGLIIYIAKIKSSPILIIVWSFFFSFMLCGSIVMSLFINTDLINILSASLFLLVILGIVGIGALIFRLINNLFGKRISG